MSWGGCLESLHDGMLLQITPDSGVQVAPLDKKKLDDKKVILKGGRLGFKEKKKTEENGSSADQRWLKEAPEFSREDTWTQICFQTEGRFVMGCAEEMENKRIEVKKGKCSDTIEIHI